MDSKEEIIWYHYKYLIEDHKFDEFDILGFLILIRKNIKNISKYKWIYEFSNMIAHRE